MDNLKERSLIISIFFGLVFTVFIGRLFFIQVFNKEYEGKANRNVIKNKIVTPSRGTIYCRDTSVYVTNSPVFDLLVTPKECYIPDTNLLIKHLGMTKEELVIALKAAMKYSREKESVIARNIDPQTYTILQEQMWNFKGFEFSPYNRRVYRLPVGANFLGYLSEADSGDIKKYPNNFYQPGDLIGKAGVERSYETDLLGKKGKYMVLKDVHNREVGRYDDGKHDQAEIPGKDALLGIDSALQVLGEKLMKNKKGSIVAIEPSTGEILAFVSSPAYDPNLLTGREFKANWKVLNADPNKPLYNRPLMATYPPGSIFKLAVALSALNEGTLTFSTHYGCGGGFRRNRGRPRCHGHPTGGLSNAIQFSCNSYFSATYMDLIQNPKFPSIYEGFNTWREDMTNFGIGHKVGIDLPYEKEGKLPTTEMYDNPKRWYGKGRWNAITIISNAIGQGEILMTPLQMAIMITTIANRGHYIQPHIVKGFRKVGTENWDMLKFPRIESSINQMHFEPVIAAMSNVVKGGTAKRANIKDIEICGKTGTVQNPHGGDHSVFVAFAPRDKPKIAIAVIIENAGASGGSWAAPLSSIMIEKYIRGTIKEKLVEYKRVSGASFMRGGK
ncbi:MAG: penicillin-binding transpeptidase domain-containing protein [Bacteroidia bacterium]